MAKIEVDPSLFVGSREGFDDLCKHLSEVEDELRIYRDDLSVIRFEKGQTYSEYESDSDHWYCSVEGCRWMDFEVDDTLSRIAWRAASHVREVHPRP